MLAFFITALALWMAFLEQAACDVLVTPHPDTSNFWGPAAKPGGFAEPDACRKLAARARAQLARRLASERTSQ